jgi:hypothetical protein
MKKRLPIALAVLLLASLACTLGGALDSADTGSSEPSSKVLFSDDFSNPNSGWPSSDDSGDFLGYADGSYRIFVSDSELLLFATSADSFQDDVQIEVDATKIGGPDDNYFGLICRYQNLDNFYFFLLSSDGYAGIGMYLNDELQFLSGEQFYYTEAINQGNSKNLVSADCIGDQLTLYANGQEVASATDSTFSSGNVGMLARANTESGVDILFDNFTVSAP